MLSFQSTQTDSSHLKPPPDHPRHLCLGSRCKPLCSDCAPALGGPRWGFDVTCFMPFHADEALNSKWPRNVHKHNEHETELHTKYFQTLRIPEVSDMCHLGLNRCFALTCISCCSPAALSSQAIAKVSAKLTLQEKHLEEYLYRFSENFEQKIAEATDSDQRDVTVAGTRSNSHRFLQYALYYMTTIYCFSLLFKENVSSNYNHSMSLQLLTLLL